MPNRKSKILVIQLNLSNSDNTIGIMEALSALSGHIKKEEKTNSNIKNICLPLLQQVQCFIIRCKMANNFVLDVKESATV